MVEVPAVGCLDDEMCAESVVFIGRDPGFGFGKNLPEIRTPRPTPILTVMRNTMGTTTVYIDVYVVPV